MFNALQLNNRNTVSIFLVIFIFISFGMKLTSLSLFLLLLVLLLSFDKLGRGFVYILKKTFDVLLSLVVMATFIYLLMLALVYFFT